LQHPARRSIDRHVGPRWRNPELFNSSDIRAIDSATIRAYVSESLLSAPQNSGLLQPFNSTH